MSFWSRQKDKTRCIRARDVFLKPSKGQNKTHLGSKWSFETAKRTNQTAPGPKMSSWTCQKDKTRCILARNVPLKPSKGQNTIASGFEMSFWSRQKDKTYRTWPQNVFLNLSKRQNKLHPGPKCLFEPAKRTKQAVSGLEMSFWTCQKESRLGPKCLFVKQHRKKFPLP